jgi:hypothetical protein
MWKFHCRRSREVSVIENCLDTSKQNELMKLESSLTLHVTPTPITVSITHPHLTIAHKQAKYVVGATWDVFMIARLRTTPDTVIGVYYPSSSPRRPQTGDIRGRMLPRSISSEPRPEARKRLRGFVEHNRWIRSHSQPGLRRANNLLRNELGQARASFSQKGHTRDLVKGLMNTASCTPLFGPNGYNTYIKYSGVIQYKKIVQKGKKKRLPRQPLA